MLRNDDEINIIKIRVECLLFGSEVCKLFVMLIILEETYEGRMKDAFINLFINLLRDDI